MKERQLTQAQALDLTHHCFDRIIKRTDQLKKFNLAIAEQTPGFIESSFLPIQRDKYSVASILTTRQEVARKRLRTSILGNATRADSLMTHYNLTMEQIYIIHKENCLTNKQELIFF